MAKTVSTVSHDHAEVSVFAFSVKGNSATVQAAVLGIARSMGLGSSVLTAPSPPRSPVSPVLAPQAAPSEESAANEAGVSDEHVAAAEAAVPSPRPSRKRQYPMPKIVDELKAESTTDGIRVFVAGRKIESTVDRTLVAATWMRENRKREQFDANDIFTCFKLMDWSRPADTASLLRNLAKTSCARAVAEGKYELTSAAQARYMKLVNG